MRRVLRAVLTRPRRSRAHCEQAATAPLQSLSSKLLKSRHCLHACNLQCEQGRTECDRSKAEVEKNDATIAALEEQERKLKLAYVEAKLAYEKAHALKYAKQQDLKKARALRLTISKESETLGGQYDARRNEWTKANEEHKKAEEMARSLSDRLEAVEKDKEVQKRRCQVHRDELARYAQMHEVLKRELDVIEASAAAV